MWTADWSIEPAANYFLKLLVLLVHTLALIKLLC